MSGRARGPGAGPGPSKARPRIWLEPSPVEGRARQQGESRLRSLVIGCQPRLPVHHRCLGVADNQELTVIVQALSLLLSPGVPASWLSGRPSTACCLSCANPVPWPSKKSAPRRPWLGNSGRSWPTSRSKSAVSFITRAPNNRHFVTIVIVCYGSLGVERANI